MGALQLEVKFKLMRITLSVKVALKILAAILPAILLTGCIGVATLQERLDDFEALSQPISGWDAAHRAEFNQKYIEWFSLRPDHSALEALDNEEIDALFKAAGMVTFYANLNHVDDQRRWLDELIRRHAATPAHYKSMHESYVRARHFAEARTLSQQHPEIDFDPLPPIVDTPPYYSSTRTVLTFSESDGGLIRLPVSGPDDGIFVIFSPSCHFSQDAIVAIQADPDLSRLFDDNTQWLQPPDGRLEYDSLRRWVVEHPWKKVGIIWRADEWEHFNLTSTPTFYFVRNGKIVGTVTGWPAEGRKAELLQAARRSGFVKD